MFIRTIVRQVVQRAAADPRVRKKASDVARVARDEARQVAREENRPQAAGRALRRTWNSLRGGQ